MTYRKTEVEAAKGRALTLDDVARWAQECMRDGMAGNTEATASVTWGQKLRRIGAVTGARKETRTP